MDAELIDRLADLRDGRARARLLRRHRDLWGPALVDRLYAQVVRLARVDLKRAERLAHVAEWLADALDDDGSRAQSRRAAGHLWYIKGRHQKALGHYHEAVDIYRRLGRDIDLARTLNGGTLQSLISLGRYDDAMAAAHQAREIYQRHGNALGLARLDTNLGNIYFRQDRFDEALTLYLGARERLATIGEPTDVAAVLSNLAMTYTSLNDFHKAQATYEQARAYCEAHDLPLLVIQADFNVAYLYYLRGEYTRSIDLYREVQERCDALGDLYHSALCDLDRSEMYLELNLSEEAAEQSERAYGRFDRLQMPYEAAKSLTILALAVSRLGDMKRASALFERGTQLFAREGNEVWLALLNYYQALVLFRRGEPGPARALCEAALQRFARAAVPGKIALCELLLARLELQAGRLDAAERACGAALARLAASEAPILSYHAHFVAGLVREARGDREGAYEAFRRADADLEHLRTHLQAEDQKIAFLDDKMAVYEGLVTSCLTLPSLGDASDAAFRYIEKAKSRSLAELIAFRATTLPPKTSGRAADSVRRLREQLNWHYREMELAELAQDGRSPRRVKGLMHRVRTLERQLMGSLDEVGRTDQEFSALQSGRAAALDEIRASLPSDALLLEYYQARGRYYVCVVSRDSLDVVPLAAAADVHRLLRLLQFQISKFRLGPSYVEAFAAQFRTAAEVHLSELYAALVAPVRNRLRASHLVIVPHGALHGLPFHALNDGQRFLVDEFTLSQAPSATVYRLCRTKPRSAAGAALIMGVPDEQTPFIADEVAAIATVLPNAHVFMGAEATIERLHTAGANSRFVHIATHGQFRLDNPMFSSIRLGDGPIGAYDLYQLRTAAELVTLSGCSTGRSVVAGGDEVLGLVRGLLYAGARAVLLTLWDTHDRTAAQFMTMFYGRLATGSTMAHASQHAMWEIRDRYPHPFYWAPYTLIGDVQGGSA